MFIGAKSCIYTSHYLRDKTALAGINTRPPSHMPSETYRWASMNLHNLLTSRSTLECFFNAKRLSCNSQQNIRGLIFTRSNRLCLSR